MSCNLCSSDTTEPLFHLRDYRLRVDDVEWIAVRCTCGLAYLNPRPTFEEVGRYYPPEYFNGRGSHGERYKRLAAHVPGDGGALLDFGTARGDFPALMQGRGWEVAGVEPFDAGNPWNLDIRADLSTFPDASFDVITAWAVFEHLHDPMAAFRQCHRLLKPGGRLVIQVPNVNSIHRLALQEDVPRHLYFFGRRTLKQYGVWAGLELSRFVHTTDLFGGSGRGALRLALVRATGHSVADFFEVYRTPQRERFRRWPVLAAAWTATSAVERVLLADRVVRAARVSGQVVAEFRKPGVMP